MKYKKCGSFLGMISGLIPFFLSAFAWVAHAAPPSAPIDNISNPGVVQIADTEIGPDARYHQVVAISDVHGMHAECLRLLLASGLIEMTAAPDSTAATDSFVWKARWKAKNTLLIITGDSIDKGPQSLAVLKLWYDLQEAANKTQPDFHDRIVVLLGNHEAEYLKSFIAANMEKKSKHAAMTAELLGQSYTDSDLAMIDFVSKDGYPLGRFLRDMPAAARVGKWAFCHAGWLPSANKLGSAASPGNAWNALANQMAALLQHGQYDNALLTGEDSLLENKTGIPQTSGGVEAAKPMKWWESQASVTELERRLIEDYGLSGIVFGHQPKAFGVIDNIGMYSPSGKAYFIKIDSGMAYPDAPANAAAVSVASPQPYMGHFLVFPHAEDLLRSGKPRTSIFGFTSNVFSEPATGAVPKSP